MDDGFAVLIGLIALLGCIFVIGIGFGQHEYTPSRTFKAVCHSQGGEPYKHIKGSRATSICIKNGTAVTIPVVTH